MQFVRVGILILVLLAGWVGVRAEPGLLVHVLRGCADGWGGGSPATTAAHPPQAT